MYQTIREPVSVTGIFKNASFTPKDFKWNNRSYLIESITSIHEFRDGGLIKRRYAVISGGNLYLLEYDRQNQTWQLIQIWHEG